MDKKLRQKFDRIEKKRLELFASLDALTTDQLNQKPAENKWSILQVMEHLMEAEAKSMEYISKKLSRPETLKKAGFADKVRSFVLNTGLSLPIKFKVPPVVDKPLLAENPTEVKADWNKLRADMQELLNSIPKEHLHKQLFKHPLAGRMTVFHALGFMEEHFDHHLRQVKRIRKVVE